MTKKTRDELEEPARTYELDAVQKQVDAHDTLIKRIDDKLEVILSSVQERPTLSQVDDKIALAVKDAIEKQDLKYGPIVSSNKWLLGLLLTSALGLFGSLIFIAIGLTR